MADLDAIASRHGVGVDAARHLLDALARGHGRAAQFNHPDLGGMGQWHAGGMTMIGDMFNAGLKARVAALCDDLAPLAAAMPAGGGSGGAGPGGGWWPEGLGEPATAGAQNDARYAYFPETRRLAVERGGRLTLYDTADHRIGGVSQQQGPDRSLGFTSQHGPVRLEDLAVVDAPGRTPPQEAEAPRAPEPAPRAQPAPEPRAHSAPPAAPSSPAGGPPGDILAMIERLSELHRKGVLTEAEFAAKKTDLLARL
ncbi:hypothetical protein OPKNFCMD_2810 [Methylobacterium crusticola]|uniref:SHOCT domain-containing protein n=1 Tax=Methylobacterium crusticola TaxID=1697972 RepID=A0ABQ4QZI3_9HYPH|nr:SHOCT domain-containing protein [Methylobacterium crusticola]GJD50074.1 hypothetical protein OPKNFCMD_2810 [Methylobacterium crusticola]